MKAYKIYETYESYKEISDISDIIVKKYNNKEIESEKVYKIKDIIDDYNLKELEIIKNVGIVFTKDSRFHSSTAAWRNPDIVAKSTEEHEYFLYAVENKIEGLIAVYHRISFEKTLKGLVLHEIQHAYDWHRSNGKISSKKAFRGRINLDNDSGRKKYIRSNIELSAFFIQAIKHTVFFDAGNRLRDIKDVYYDFKSYFGQTRSWPRIHDMSNISDEEDFWKYLTPKLQKHLTRKFFQYYYKIKEESKDTSVDSASNKDNNEIEIQIKTLIDRLGREYTDELALQASIANKRIDFVEYLLKTKKINLNGKDSYAFQIAVEFNNIEALKLLLSKTDIDSDKKHTGISIAAEKGYIEIVKILLKTDLNIYAKNEALKSAVRRAHIEIIKLLLDAGADVHAKSDEALRCAAEYGHTEIVKMLLDAGANVHAGMDEALRLAAENGSTEIVKMLLDAGANVHAMNDYALHWAAKKGRTETVQVLKDHIAKENKAKTVKESLSEKFVEDSDPVEDLIGTRKKIDEFIDSIGEVASIDSIGEVAPNDDIRLVFCARHGKTKWVKFLLNQGANITAWENAALRSAAENGHAETVKVLLDAGADVHVWDDYALRWAAINRHMETVQVIKDHIAKEKEAKKVRESLDEKFVEDSDPVEDLGLGIRKQIAKFLSDKYGKGVRADYVALAECARFGKTEWVKFLLARGANVHFAEDYALRYAATNGHTEIVKMLLDAGADVHAMDDYALRYAAANRHTETVQVLKDHITKENKAKKVNEKFVEDSDPLEDLGLTLEARLLKAFLEISKMATLTLRTDISDQLFFKISDYSANSTQNFEYYAKILKPFYNKIYIVESNIFRTHIKVIIKSELYDVATKTYQRWVNEYYTVKKI